MTFTGVSIMKSHDKGAKKGNVGIIGVGLLGAVFIARLKAAGFDVLAFDICSESRDQAQSQGAKAAQSMAELALACSSILVTVYSTGQVRSVIKTIADVPNKERAKFLTILCSTTLDPDSVNGVYQQASEAGIEFVEFPVSGTSSQVAKGEGFGLLGCNPELFVTQYHIINSLTPRSINFCKIGAASRAKLAINLVLEINRSALAEGLIFAELLGVETDVFIQALKASAAYSSVMNVKADKMLQHDFTPEGRCSQSLKDIQMMLKLARKRRQTLPLTSTQADLLMNCVEAQEGDLDSSAVIYALRRLKAT